MTGQELQRADREEWQSCRDCRRGGLWVRPLGRCRRWLCSQRATNRFVAARLPACLQVLPGSSRLPQLEGKLSRFLLDPEDMESVDRLGGFQEMCRLLEDE